MYLLVSVGNYSIQLFSNYIPLVMLEKTTNSTADMVDDHQTVNQRLCLKSSHSFLSFFCLKSIIRFIKITGVHIFDYCLDREGFRLEVLSNFKVYLFHSF